MLTLTINVLQTLHINLFNNTNMARPKKWNVGKFKNFKLKLYGETADRYQQVLSIKKKTVQQDFEDHVNQTIQ